MTKRLSTIALFVFAAVLIMPLAVWAQDPGAVPAIPAGYETVYLLLSTLGGALIVPFIQFLKGLTWYPKTNSSWLDWTFQFVCSFVVGAILSVIYVKKFELNQIFLVAFIMVISSLVNTLRKTATK